MQKIKSLIQRIKSNSGRSVNGSITSPRRSSLIKKLYRFVDFSRDRKGSAVLLRFEYDPNRNCKIALLVFTEGFLTYIIPAETNLIGSKIVNNNITNKLSPGDTTEIIKVSSGSLLYQLSKSPSIPAQFVRSAGSSCILVKNQGRLSLIKMRSGEYRYFFSNSLAAIGKVNFGDYFLKDWRIAGKSRRLGFRPRNRALARNPVDHPMGGRTKGGTPKLSPAGKICLNTETRINRNFFVVIKPRERKKL